LRGTIALKGGSPFVVFLEQKGYLDNCQVVPFFGGIGRFVADSDFSQQAYSFSEPLLARRQGSDPRALMLSDEGFNPYAGMVVTTTSTIDEKPDLVRKFAQASLRGWRQYLFDPSDTNKRLATLNSELDTELLAEGVEALRELCHDPSSPEFGRMEAARWSELEAQLVELKLIPAGKADVAGAF